MGVSGGHRHRRRLGRRSRLYELILAPLTPRERWLLGGSLIGLVLIVVIPRVSAGSSRVGSYVYAPVTQCESADDSWLGTIQATGQPDAGLNSEPDPSNMAIWRSGDSAMVCGALNPDQDAITRPTVQLHVRLGESALPVNRLHTDSSDTASSVTTAPLNVIDPTAVKSQPLDGLLAIEWSRDGGNTWQPLYTLDESEMNASPVTIQLPPFARSDLLQLAIRLHAVALSDQAEPILVDSLGLLYQIGQPAEFNVNLNGGTDQTTVLAAGEPASALVTVKPSESNFVSGIGSKVLGRDEEPDVDIGARLVGNDGRGHDLEIYTQWRGAKLDGTFTWDVTYRQPNQLDPGKYRLVTSISPAEDGGEVLEDSQDVLWGVVAINTAKSSYLPGETAEFLMSVLDGRGATVCDADITLSIFQNGSIVATKSSGEGSIKVTDTCRVYGEQTDPDYTAELKLDREGIYEIELLVSASEQIYSLRDSLEVATDKPFVITRSGPTRVFPLNAYDMELNVRFNRDFRGTIDEFIPASYKLLLSPDERPYETTSDENKTKLSWAAEAAAGDELIYRYRFDAPDISPVFYTHGPAVFREGDNQIFNEPRAWQVAGDAIGRMLVLWDGGSVPTDWTCVSCASGDPFYQRFIRGESAYGATGGGATHTHTASGSVDATSDPMPARSNTPTPNELTNNSHAHTFSPAIGSASNLPSYRQLRVIRYDFTGEPASLPAGAIVLFDDTLPSGWTQYSSQDGYYIRGESSASTTGGNNDHTHAITGSTGVSTSGQRRRATAGAQSNVSTEDHTHDAAGTSQSAILEPPYIETILGKLDSDDTPPNNMIAMWDASPPSEWVIRSNSGGTFYQRFIKPASSFGTTGGSSDHTHVDTSYASGIPSATTTSRTGGTVNASDGAHTHQINVTNFSTDSHLPPYIDVILAKKQQPSVLEQSAYRWYANQDSTDVGSPLAAQNTATSAPRQGTPFRLRFLIDVSDTDRSINGSGLKLQAAERSGSCDVSFIGETYADVSESSGDIRFYDNVTPSDGDTLTSNANDPTHSGHTVNEQTYDEANNFTNTVSAVPLGEDGLWDVALEDFSAASSTGYCFRVIRATGSLLDTYSVIPEITTDDGTGHMLLLWAGSGSPSGWSCVSCNPGDDFYQRFPRGEATFGGSGGSATHTHTASGSISTSSQSGRGNVGTGLIRAHDHPLTPTIEAGNSLPAYRQLKVIRADSSGTPGTIPSGAIALFDAAVPGGWTRYSAQDGSYIRGEGTLGTTGGSNTHTHTVSGTTSTPTNGIIRAPNTTGTQVTAATDDHTHTISGTSPSANQEPPYIDTILGQIDSDGSVPTSMLAMWDGDPPVAWAVQSQSGGPFYQSFMKPAATYGGTGGTVTHNHADNNITSSAPSATLNTQTGGTNVTSSTHTHTATISAYSTENNLPPYRNVIVAKLTGTNTPPNDPASPDQIKISDSSSIAVGGWANDVQVEFSADMDDPDDPDSLSLCVEVQPLGTDFINTDSACGSAVNFSGSPVSGTVTIFGLTNTEEYHWQARVKDGFGAYSGWESFGSNAESARDFAIDDTDPSGAVYDGSTPSVDVDFNSGSLSALSANWSFSDADSGINGYEYSIGSSPGATDLTGWTNIGTNTSQTQPSLNLVTSQPYFFNVRAADTAGNQVTVSSDGQFVAPSLSFSASPVTVTFNNLNSANGYSDTQSTTLTTSTNAYGGYVVRLFSLSLPTSDAGDTIADFSGGTYINPDEWLGGDTGYGFTSNDTTIQGINLFNSTPCASGGNPPCFAPYSLSSPGDIAADHTDPVIGTEVLDENFIISHRVSVQPSQPSGTYTTEFVYTVTARY